MSTATAFIFPRSFPFCAEDISGTVNSAASYLDNLTLAEVMAFAWNLESFTLTPAGSVTNGSETTAAPPEITINPMAGTNVTHGEFNDGSMWFGDSASYTTLGALPAMRTPVERICQPSQTVTGCLLDFNVGDPGTRLGFELGFWIGTDPLNSGKYRLYYRLDANTDDALTQTVELYWDNSSTTPGGLDPAGSGTITIGGFNFPWYAYCSAGDTPSGVGLTASSTSFTY